MEAGSLQAPKSIGDEPVLDQIFGQMAAAFLSPIADLAFGEMGLSASAAQEPAFGQPASVVNVEGGEKALAITLGLTSPPQANRAAQTDWIADDFLAYLRQSAKLAVWTTGLGGLDGNGDDGID